MHMVLVEEGYSDSLSDLLSESYENNRTFPGNSLTNFDSDSYDNMVTNTAMVGDTMMVRHPTMVGHTVMSGCGLSGSHDDSTSPLSSSLHSCSTESMTSSHNAADSPANTDTTVIVTTGNQTKRRFSSPASYNFSVDARNNTKGKKTATHVHFDDQTSLHDTTTVAMETDNAEPNGLLEKHRLLMRQSISQGMSAIMNRIVSEPRPRALPRQPQNVTIATSLSLKETVMQPLDSEETKSLQLVPSPAAGVQERDGGYCEFKEEGGEEEGGEEEGGEEEEEEEGGEEEEEGGEEEEEGAEEERNKDQEAGGKDGGCDLIPSGEAVDEVEGMTEGLEHGEREYVDCKHHEPQRVEENGERASTHQQHDQEASNEADSQSSGVLLSPGPRLSDVREGTALDCSRQNLLQSYFRTSKVALFQSELTVYPTFQAHASFYPSFLHCEYFSSEMDLFQSLSTLMETKLSKTVQMQGPASSEDEQNWSDPNSSARKERRTSDHEDLPSPPCASLISPSRRSRLIDQATRAVKLKYSFNDCPTNLDDISLLSPTLDNTPSSLVHQDYQHETNKLGQESWGNLPGAGRGHKANTPISSAAHHPAEAHSHRGTYKISDSTNGSMMQPLSNLSASLVSYTQTHDSFPAEELTANFEFHQRQASFPDSCGGHSSVGTLNSRSGTPSGSQGSVEMTFSNTQPSRQLSSSSVILPYHQKSLPSSPHNIYPPSSLMMHSQKSLSYLSVLQHTGGQAANRKPYPAANIALHQTFRSTEVLNTATHREVLCTFGSFRRPLTVLMSNQSKSTLSLSNPWSPSNHWSPSNQTIMDQQHPVFHSTQNLPKN